MKVRFPCKLTATEWQMMINALVEEGMILPTWKSYIDVKDKTIEFEFEPLVPLIEDRYLPLQRTRDEDQNSQS